MTLYKGAVLLLENQPSGYQRKFKVVEYSSPSRDAEKEPETQLVRLEIIE